MQGRGSAANSAVCYSLGITAVDPVGMELLFERFLSEERGEWPDIDLDLPSGDRRERVIQHVYEKYGQHGAAMTANVITYRGKSAAREVGKALNLDAGADRSAREGDAQLRVPGRRRLARRRTCRRPASTRRQPQVVHFARLWQQMQDLPRHLGQHSGGMVICQGALSSVVPLENASMPGRVVVQWDKEDCADMGLIKVDLLGLGMMSALQDALAIINTGLGARGPGSGKNVADADSVALGAVGNLSSAIQRDSPGPEPRAPSPAQRPLDWRTCRRTIQRSTRCCKPPTPSGCSKSSRGRRWRRCRGSSRRASTTWWCRWRSSGPGRSSGRWCIRISIAAPAASRSSTTIRCSSRC